METLSPLRYLAAADWVALSLLIAGWLLIGHFSENPPKGRPSVSWLMRAYRRDWMVQFIGNPAHERFYGKRNDRMPAYLGDGVLDERSIALIADWLRGDWYVAPGKSE